VYNLWVTRDTCYQWLVRGINDPVTDQDMYDDSLTDSEEQLIKNGRSCFKKNVYALIVCKILRYICVEHWLELTERLNFDVFFFFFPLHLGCEHFLLLNTKRHYWRTDTISQHVIILTESFNIDTLVTVRVREFVKTLNCLYRCVINTMRSTDDLQLFSYTVVRRSMI
jgi:hypothetical protein